MMPLEEAGKCAVCGSKNLMVCYGIAFGGLGPYVICEDCDEVVCKHVIEPGLCLSALDPSPSDEPRAPSPAPSDG